MSTHSARLLELTEQQQRARLSTLATEWHQRLALPGDERLALLSLLSACYSRCPPYGASS
jgi:hypothetical protein